MAAIDGELAKESVWSSPEAVRGLRQKRARLEDTVNPYEALEEKLHYVESSMGVLDEEGGELFLDEISGELRELRESLEDLELRSLLSGEHDASNAIVTVHPGAGGIESQDWAQMLMRMYLRWAEIRGFETTVTDVQPAEEAGIKGATFTVAGPYAYGYLKVEAGVHRLVRISPFDANKRRHTSFSAVLVYPEIEDDVSVEIRDEDLRVDTFRASGAGGQHVNKTSSAVRITHIPSGIVVSCQNERSQHRNREMAMKILRSRLYDMERSEQERALESLVGEKKDIAWGSQIRSYVLQPYRLVKDHRTGVEAGNVDAVLDGSIDAFIKAALRLKGSSSSSIKK
ncbi:MAG: peptide chain release factor 2 [Thermodesulfovibrionales bacterium]